jgi:hypothetical protein
MRRLIAPEMSIQQNAMQEQRDWPGALLGVTDVTRRGRNAALASQ